MARKPWDRMEGESDKAFAAFNVYKNLTPSERSKSRVSYEIYDKKRGMSWASDKKPHGRVNKWSVDFNWVERAGAWDVEQARVANAQLALERHDEIRAFLEKQLEIAKDAQDITGDALVVLKNKANVDTDDALFFRRMMLGLDVAYKQIAGLLGVHNQDLENVLQGEGEE